MPEDEAGYFSEQAADLARSRDRLASGLAAAGYVSLPCQGTYFLNIDLSASGIETDDETFCRRAVQEAGIAAIPVSCFYAQDPVRHVVRLCFAKSDQTLDLGLEALIRARALF